MAKIALLIGVSEYPTGLPPLPGAIKDVEAMQRVLENPELGSFDEVRTLSNPEPFAMQEAIENLLSDRAREDLVLLFFSGHGVKDDSGRLYFATRVTRKNPKGDLVKATAVPAGFVQDIMSHSRCKRQVVLLDCCFSGAFVEGMTAKDDGVVDIQTQLGGEGRAVLTSSTSTQYSFEQQDSELSVYTQYIVEGIETGAADTDNDGAIAVDELHEYVQKKVQEAAPAMKPKIYAVEEGFKIRLAKVAIGDPKLSYRKEVERRSSRGGISPLGRRILDDLRDSLGLASETATMIEEEVLKPYREYQKKLQRYEQAFVELVQQEYPLSDATRDELHRYQEILGLRHEDIIPVERKHRPRRETTESPVLEATPAQPTATPVSSVPSQLRPESVRVQKVVELSNPSVDPSLSARNSSTPRLENISTAIGSRSRPRLPIVLGSIGCLGFSIMLVSAIVLPSFLNQASKAKQSEAKTYIGSLNRSQQAFFLEKNKFSSSIEELGIGIQSETVNYKYKTQAYGSGMKGYAISTATPKVDGLKGYVGGAFIVTLSGSQESTTLAIICEGNVPSTVALSPPKLQGWGNGPECASGSTQLK
jgi:type II secretory pathway pseudopilin PulG